MEKVIYKEKELNDKSVPTTVLLDFVAKDIPYTLDKERDKQTNYANELEQREPFRDIKRKIDRMSKQIIELNEVVTKLLIHTHHDNGMVVIPLEGHFKQVF